MRTSFTIPGCFFCMVLLAGFSIIKWPVKKIHAYKQASIPGILPVLADETGNKQREERKQTYNYWFYIELLKNDSINIDGLWIAGLRCELKTETVTTLPVKKIIYTGSMVNDTITMAPATQNKVLLVYPSGVSKDTVITSRYLKKLTATFELVIAYTWKKKKYYAGIKKVKELPPDVHP